METCTCCSGIAVTREHVPPNALFAPPRPNALITVPCCASCNTGAHLDDQYFVHMVLWYHRLCDVPPAATQVAKMVERMTASTARGYWNRLYRMLPSLTLRTPDGLYLGSAPAVAVDRARMARVVYRVVRGLLAHSFGRKRDTAAELIVPADPDAVREHRAKIEQLLAGPNVKESQEGYSGTPRMSRRTTRRCRFGFSYSSMSTRASSSPKRRDSSVSGITKRAAVGRFGSSLRSRFI